MWAATSAWGKFTLLDIFWFGYMVVLCGILITWAIRGWYNERKTKEREHEQEQIHHQSATLSAHAEEVIDAPAASGNGGAPHSGG